MTDPQNDPEPSASPPLRPSLGSRVRRFLLGRPRKVTSPGVFHHLSLVAFLAWVGLGADGLSSSAYGPEEAFRALGDHRYLAIALALVMAGTVFLISTAYTRIIERFPHGGGGYLVATKLLGEKVGVVSGSALLVDYVLTITVSVAAAGDALFSFIPGAEVWKLPVEVALIVGLTTLNLRGVRESVMVLTPIFVLFVVTHLVLIVGGIALHAPEMPETASEVTTGFSKGFDALGLGGMLFLLMHAFSMGGGTYTGIEAVSNGLMIMRQPRVETAKRTMRLMATSLAFTAAGLMLCYLLWDVGPVAGKTMNAVLAERFSSALPFGAGAFVVTTLIAEAALLIVAAQAGFLDGPRVLASMAVDSWVPRRFAALSDRLTTQNGILLMGAAAVAALLYTQGSIGELVVMYAINVFLTFSLSLFGMLLLSWRRRTRDGKGRVVLFGSGFAICALILVFTVHEKFLQGGWVTLVATGSLIVLCFVIKAHYVSVVAKMRKLYATLEDLPERAKGPPPAVDPKQPTAVILVARYGGVGIHTVLQVIRDFRGHFRNFVFVSVGVVDSGRFKGEEELEALEHETNETLERYVDLAHRLGCAATFRMAIGTDAVDEAEKLCTEIAREFPNPIFFASKVIFHRPRWYERVLHNETAMTIQRRLQLRGLTMVNFPARVE